MVSSHPIGADPPLAVPEDAGQSRWYVLRNRNELALGVAAGLAGGIAMAIPIVIWDAVRASHAAFELPQGVTAWLFGLEHFTLNGTSTGSLVAGILVLAGVWALLGVAFAVLADKVFTARHVGGALAVGVAWGIACFLVFWDMILPLARNGSPLRQTASNPAVYVAPNWPWILGFLLLGVVTGLAYAAFRPLAARRPGALEDRRHELHLVAA